MMFTTHSLENTISEVLLSQYADHSASHIVHDDWIFMQNVCHNRVYLQDILDYLCMKYHKFLCMDQVLKCHRDYD